MRAGFATCPGALLALAIWLLASLVVRTWLEASLGGSSIYGPLSTPIVLLIWLYALAIAILIGAGLNAATRVMWPVELRDEPARSSPLGRQPALSECRTGRQRGGRGGRPTAPDQRSRDQQFAKRERSHSAEAIDRRFAEGVGRPRDERAPKG